MNILAPFEGPFFLTGEPDKHRVVIRGQVQGIYEDVVKVELHGEFGFFEQGLIARAIGNAIVPCDEKESGVLERFVERMANIGQLECSDPACLACANHREAATALFREARHSRDDLIHKMAYALEHFLERTIITVATDQPPKASQDAAMLLDIRELIEEARR